MSTGRELLELAAKAAGYDHLIWTPGASPLIPGSHRVLGQRVCWNPLTDDGDALRLAVKLNIEIIPQKLWIWAAHPSQNAVIKEPPGSDSCAATRIAITRAAAEIGKAKP